MKYLLTNESKSICWLNLERSSPKRYPLLKSFSKSVILRESWTSSLSQLRMRSLIESYFITMGNYVSLNNLGISVLFFRN